MNIKKQTIKICAFPTPFEIFHRQEKDIDFIAGETIQEAAKRAFPQFKLNTFARGIKRISASELVNPNDVIVCWSIPESGVDWAAVWAVTKVVMKVIGAILSVAAIGYSVYSYMQSRKLMKSLKNTAYGKEVDDASDTNFGWNFDAQNAAAEGSPLPVLYGKRYVIPPVIQQRVVVSQISGAEYLEVITAVSQGGAGFVDSIAFPNNEQGDLDILLNHAHWSNYISKEQYSSDSSEEVNRLHSGINVYNGVYWDGSGLISSPTAYDLQNLVDGDTTTRARGLSGSQKYGYMNLPDPDKQRDTKHTRNFYFALDDVCKISRVRFFTSKKDITFDVYAGNTSDITTFTKIGSFAGNGQSKTWKTCICNTNGVFYKNVLISNFKGSSKAEFYEIEVYGSINVAAEENITGYAEVETRPGDYNQSPVTICGGVWAALNVGKGLSLDYFTYKTSKGASPEKLSITLEFPYGLYDSSGATLESKTVKVACWYRGVKQDGSTGLWTVFNSEFAGGVVEISDTTTSPKKVQFETESLFSEFDHFEIRMKLHEDPGLGANVVGTCNWELVEEGYSHKPIYPNTALAAVRMLSTKALAGGVPQIKVMAERPYVLVYNSIEEEWQAKNASNPAWIAYDLIVRPLFDDTTAQELDEEETELFDEDTGRFNADISPYLRETVFPVHRVKYSDFEKWADFCDDNNISCSMYFDGTSTVSESLQYICEIGRGGLVNRANVLGVVIDSQAENLGLRNEPVPLFRFDDSNIVADSYSEEYRDRKNFPSEVQVTYFDKDREYTRKSVLARTDEARLSYNAKDITLYPCNDIEVARDHAEYVLGLNKLKKNYSWTGDLDSMPLDLGDLVEVNSKLMTITGVSFDEELRREFKAMEYVHERFGWLKWMVGVNQRSTVQHGSTKYILHSLPWASPPGISLGDIYGRLTEGNVIASGPVSLKIDKTTGVYSILALTTGSNWLANRPIRLRAVKDFDLDFYQQEEDVVKTMTLVEGWNLRTLTFDIVDWYETYKNIDGVDYTELLTFERSVVYKDVEFIESKIPFENGKKNLYANVAYKIYASEKVDLPMFPPN
jgi:hypothetical protein